MAMLSLQGEHTMQINGGGRLLGAAEDALCAAHCDFWLLKARRWANQSEGEIFQ